MVFKVYPKKESIMKDMNMDMGIANPTNNAFLKPRKNINTVTTKITPKMIEFTNSLIWFKVMLD
jgi:hypothetical protein